MKRFIVCIFVAFMCSTVNANIDSKSGYEISYKYKTTKSVRKIIREILNRKRIEKLKMPNTIPIPLHHPLYDINPEKVRNLA